MAIADVRDLVAAKLQFSSAIVEHDEIVARAVHLGEVKHNRASTCRLGN